MVEGKELSTRRSGDFSRYFNAWWDVATEYAITLNTAAYAITSSTAAAGGAGRAKK